MIKKALLSLIVILALLAGWTILRWKAPPLRVDYSPNAVTIDVATLGEYPTSIDEIRLLDANRMVIWEVAGQRGEAQIYRLTLRVGNNPAHLVADHGTYQIVTPTNIDHFVLSRGGRYWIELRGGSSVLSQRSASFTLQ